MSIENDKTVIVYRFVGAAAVGISLVSMLFDLGD